jgi:hypothetical protein
MGGLAGTPGAVRRAELPGDPVESIGDFSDGLVECGGAGRQPHPFAAAEPVGPQLVGPLDLVDAASEGAGGAGKLGGVVAVGAAHDDEGLAASGEFAQRLLPVLGRLANGIDVAGLGLGSAATDLVDDLRDPLDRPGRLGDDADPLRRLWQLPQIGPALDHEGLGEIAGEPSHLDMVGSPDDHGKVARQH